MKSDKGKTPKKVSNKKNVAKVEESLRAKLFELIASLGHDVVDVSDEVYEMSKRLAKKLSKKVKNVFSQNDSSPVEEKSKKSKDNSISQKSKDSKSKKKPKKIISSQPKAAELARELSKPKKKDQSKIDKAKKSKSSSDEPVAKIKNSPVKSSDNDDEGKNKSSLNDKENSKSLSSESFTKQASVDLNKAKNVVEKSQNSSNGALPKIAPVKITKKPTVSNPNKPTGKVAAKPANNVSKLSAVKKAIPAKLPAKANVKISTTATRARSVKTVSKEEKVK